MVLNQGRVCPPPPGDIWQCPKTFLVVTLEWGVAAGTRGAAAEKPWPEAQLPELSSESSASLQCIALPCHLG